MSFQPMPAKIVAAPSKPVSKGEIIQAIRDKEKAEVAKAKPRKERTAEDKIAIIKNVLNNIPEPTVLHADSKGSKLDMLA